MMKRVLLVLGAAVLFVSTLALPASRRLYCAAKIDERHKPATNLTKTEQERSQRCSLQRFAV
jgi:hypothetical protein